MADSSIHPTDSIDDRSSTPAPRLDLDERERQLADARAEFRRERAQLAADRIEIDRLKREAKTVHREAERSRDRTKRLAARYARRVKQKWSDVRADLESQRAAIDDSRGAFSAEIVRFETVRSEFHAAAADDKDRQRDAWDALEAHRKRAVAEWTEANEFAAKQDAALAARTAELTRREQALGAAKAQLEEETEGLRKEAAGIEARAEHTRAVVEELEKKRDELRAELLASLPPADAPPHGPMVVALDRAADRDLVEWAAELDAQDRHILHEKVKIAKLQEALARDAARLADERKVLAEQFLMLAAARSEWQDAERRTVAEMEELARGLRLRDEEFAAREERLIAADARRREEGHDLWRLRLTLEAWQSKLTAVSRLWHAERERREEEYNRRLQSAAHRDAALQDAFERWDRARAGEGERLRTELQLWADDRIRMMQAIDACDSHGRAALSEVSQHAARALASENLLAEKLPKATTTRRFNVLRKRWDAVYRKKLDAFDRRRAAAQADLARVDDRYRDLHLMLAEATARVSNVNARAARGDAASLAVSEYPTANAPAARPTELAALRDEFERMANVLLEAGVPEPPDEQLPWAAEESDPEPDVLPFTLRARAA